MTSPATRKQWVVSARIKGEGRCWLTDGDSWGYDPEEADRFDEPATAIAAATALGGTARDIQAEPAP